MVNKNLSTNKQSDAMAGRKGETALPLDRTSNLAKSECHPSIQGNYDVKVKDNTYSPYLF